MSRHLDIDDILAKEPGYVIPVEAVVKALLFEDLVHYDPQRSVFINLFDVARSDPQEHFSRILTLRFLAALDESGPSHGFVRIEETIRYLCQLEYSQEHSSDVIEYLYHREYCESKVHGQKWKERPTELRTTNLGKYHLSFLLPTFQYFDAVIIDTPILDDVLRVRITDSNYIKDRLERSLAFLHYLNSCSKTLQDADAVAYWNSVAHVVESGIQALSSNT